MISKAIRPIAIAAIATFAVIGAAQAGDSGRYYNDGYRYYDNTRIHPSGSYNYGSGAHQNFTNLPRDTRYEGFINRHGLDWGHHPYSFDGYGGYGYR